MSRFGHWTVVALRKAKVALKAGPLKQGLRSKAIYRETDRMNRARERPPFFPEAAEQTFFASPRQQPFHATWNRSSCDGTKERSCTTKT